MNARQRNTAPLTQTTAYVQTKETHMSDDNEMMMARYGITSAPKMMYFYKQYQYEKLGDALRYAEIDTARTQESTIDTLTEQ